MYVNKRIAYIVHNRKTYLYSKSRDFYPHCNASFFRQKLPSGRNMLSTSPFVLKEMR